MQKEYEKIVNKLLKAPLYKEEFDRLIHMSLGTCLSGDEEFEYLKSSGLPLLEIEGKIELSTTKMDISKQIFCIVDIETNGSTPSKSQIIEIGAIKLQNGEILDSFDTLIKCNNIPEYISKITNISQDDLSSAPTMCEVLKKFRLFLSDSLFVAHNVNFDYPFISEMLKRCKLGELNNRRLCTIDLARKTIVAQKYGLGHLNEVLEINTSTSHRAYADALTTTKVLQESLKNLPLEVVTTEDLIHFSHHQKVKKKKRKSEDYN